MKIFLDSADIEEIKEAESWGIIEGVTTNPSLIKEAVDKYKKGGGKFSMEDYICDVLKVMAGKSVSLEVTGNNFKEMVREGQELYDKFNPIAGNVVIKIPVDPNTGKGNDMDGIKTISELSKKGIPVNCTLIFDPEQAILAAKAGARYVSPFVGRFDDYLREKNGIKFEKKDYFPVEGIKKDGKRIEYEGLHSGVELVQKIAKLFEKNKVQCEIIAASIRNGQQLEDVFSAGTDIATVSFDVLKNEAKHEKTKEGMKKFMKDSVSEYRKIMKGKK
ncbi:MAG: transaldolase family protein [Nanoarchaeota archaeon]